jgi:hypothetical protein
VNPETLPAGYDNTSDFPSEPAGWGEPGIRHAEAIGHGVWMAEHPDDALSTDELIARSQAARADLDTALANVRKHFGTQAMCPIPTCVRPDHPVWEMCEDEVGHSWFQGDTEVPDGSAH